MRSTAASAVVLFAAQAAAASASTWGGNWGIWKSSEWSTENKGACMTDADAQTVANNFEALIANYSDALANATLTENFHDYTDSVIELIDSGCPNGPVPLGVPTFDSRASFEIGQGSQPPIPFKQLNVWHNCETVTLRWMSAMTPSNVTGIIVMETTKSNGTWLINTVYSEFNSGAWLVDLGVFKPTNCSAGGAGGAPPHRRR